MVISYAEGAFMEWRMVAWLTIIYTVVPVIFIHIFVPERYVIINKIPSWNYFYPFQRKIHTDNNGKPSIIAKCTP